MYTLTVAGTCSGVGKTTLVCHLLSGLADWGALKISTHPSRGRRRGVPVESMITDPAVLDRPDTGTARFRLAGASLVVWLRPTPESLAADLGPALDRFRGLPGAIVEGNSHLLHRRTDRVILLAREGLDDVKPSAWKILDRVDRLVFNRRRMVPRPDYDPAVLRRLEARFEPDRVIRADIEAAGDPGMEELRRDLATWFPR